MLITLRSVSVYNVVRINLGVIKNAKVRKSENDSGTLLLDHQVGSFIG